MVQLYRIVLILVISSISAGLFGQIIPESIPRDTTFNISAVNRKYLKYFPYIQPADTTLPDNVEEARNVVYATVETSEYGKRDLHLDVFRPKTKGKYPVLVLIHGGGWRSGDKSLQQPLAKQLAAKGYVTVTVEYQLSLEAKYPAAIFNVKSAIRWLRANAGDYSIDPDRIAVSGSSAGGQIASLVGVTNGIEKFEGDMGVTGFSSAIQAVIDMDGVINFLAPASLNLPRGATSPDVEWLGDTFENNPMIWKEASPIYWVNETTPPFLILKSGFPRFTAGSHELVGLLNNYGIYNQVKQIDVHVHPFWLLDPWFDTTVGYMERFLDAVFKDKYHSN